MGGVAKGAEVGIVRGYDDGAAAGREEAVKLLYRPDDVRDVLDDMDCSKFAKRIIAERKRETTETGLVARRLPYGCFSTGRSAWVGAADVPPTIVGLHRPPYSNALY